MTTLKEIFTSISEQLLELAGETKRICLGTSRLCYPYHVPFSTNLDIHLYVHKSQDFSVVRNHSLVFTVPVFLLFPPVVAGRSPRAGPGQRGERARDRHKARNVQLQVSRTFGGRRREGRREGGNRGPGGPGTRGRGPVMAMRRA